VIHRYAGKNTTFSALDTTTTKSKTRTCMVLVLIVVLVLVVSVQIAVQVTHPTLCTEMTPVAQKWLEKPGTGGLVYRTKSGRESFRS
jgi:hypothetical protein